jgi:negative regulator of sigma E activity
MPSTDPAERSDISAFLDGELQAIEARRVINAMVSDQARQADFRTYCLIGDALRGQATGPVSADFVSRVSARLAEEPTVLAPSAGRKLTAGWITAMAASVVAVGLVVAVAWQGTEEATVTVLRASLEDAHTKALLESHGSMIVRLRMTQEEDRP